MTWPRWPTALPAAGVHRRPVRAAVAGRGPEDRLARRPRSTSGSRAAVERLRAAVAVRGRRALGRRALGRPLRHGSGRRRLPRARLPPPPAGPAGEVPARRADRSRGPDPGGPGRARPDGHARGVPRGHRPGRRTRGGPRAQGAEVRARSSRPGPSTWSSSRRWSGWCARSSGIPDPTGRVVLVVLALMDRPRPPVSLGDDDRPPRPHPTSARRRRRPPRSTSPRRPTPSAPPASSATRSRSSTSCTARRCG